MTGNGLPGWLAIAVGLVLAAGLVLIAVPGIVEAAARRWGCWRGRRDGGLELRRVDVGPPAGLAERRHVNVGPGGRHRRDSPVVTDPLTMTGFTRQLDADTGAAHARMQAAQLAETGTLRLPTERERRAGGQ